MKVVVAHRAAEVMLVDDTIIRGVLAMQMYVVLCMNSTLYLHTVNRSQTVDPEALREAG